MDPTLLLLRWAHVLAAIVAMGGLVFARFALLPALSELDASTRDRVHERIRRHWLPWVIGAITLLLASGLANFLLFNARVKGEEWAGGQWMRETNYHALFGAKFLMALVVFYLASALVVTKDDPFTLGLQKKVAYFDELLSEIRLQTRVDGPNTVGVDQEFGIQPKQYWDNIGKVAVCREDLQQHKDAAPAAEGRGLPHPSCNHEDAVLDLAFVGSSYASFQSGSAHKNPGFLLSASRDGVVKAWV
jgi:uncharacterized membrane protein